MTPLALRAAGWRPLIARLPAHNFRRESSKISDVHDIYSGRRKQLELQRQREEQRAALASGQPADGEGNVQPPATYATLADHESGAGRRRYDENTGIRPSNRQRFWLVAMRIYPSRIAIPEYVGAGEMNRMANRFRVFYMTGMMAFLGVLFLLSETQMHKMILRDGARNADDQTN